MFAAEEIEIGAPIDSFQFLDIDAEISREGNQILMVRIDQLAAELAKHSVLVEVVLSKDAAAGALAAFEDLAGDASLMQAIGRR